MHEHVYQPAEDSYLLQQNVQVEVVGEVLDMGTGNGIQAITAAKKPAVTKVIAVDISLEALKTAQENAVAAGVSAKITFRISDLFQQVPEKFDFIIFNPPYLPTDPEEGSDEASRAWDGGVTGSEVVTRFLDEVEAHLKPDGRVFLVLSSLTGGIKD